MTGQQFMMTPISFQIYALGGPTGCRRFGMAPALVECDKGQAMYRISRVFDNSSTVLVKIAGEIEQNDNDEWRSFLRLLAGWGTREIILDFCEVKRVSPQALMTLMEHLAPNLFLVNCYWALRSTVTSFGHGDRLLDKDTNGGGLTLDWPAPDRREI